jgi:hypothetical protein
LERKQPHHQEHCHKKHGTHAQRRAIREIRVLYRVRNVW